MFGGEDLEEVVVQVSDVEGVFAEWSLGQYLVAFVSDHSAGMGVHGSYIPGFDDRASNAQVAHLRLKHAPTRFETRRTDDFDCTPTLHVHHHARPFHNGFSLAMAVHQWCCSHRVKKGDVQAKQLAVQFQTGIHVGHGDAHVLDSLDGVLRKLAHSVVKLRELETLEGAGRHMHP